MFDNQVLSEENKNEDVKEKSSSFSVSFTDEELVSGKISSEDDEIQKIIKEEEEKEETKEAVFNGFLAFKTKIEQILNSEDYEDIIVDFVDQLLLAEQNSLREDTTKKIKLQKYIAGLVFTSANCYGDQHNFLLLMAERLGVRR